MEYISVEPIKRLDNQTIFEVDMTAMGAYLAIELPDIKSLDTDVCYHKHAALHCWNKISIDPMKYSVYSDSLRTKRHRNVQQWNSNYSLSLGATHFLSLDEIIPPLETKTKSFKLTIDWESPDKFIVPWGANAICVKTGKPLEQKDIKVSLLILTQKNSP
jgi:hypothetical protein